MNHLGPQIAFVDDKRWEVLPIQEELNESHIGTIFFKVDITEMNFPAKPIDTIKHVFLDLYYNSGFGAEFDPEICIDWLNHIVPPNHYYTLIILTRDPHKEDELIQEMKKEQIRNEKFSYPETIHTIPKEKYQNGGNIRELLDEVGVEYTEYIEIPEECDEFHGQIMEVEEFTVLINCLISESPKRFEVRRFDLELFKDYMELKENNFLKIRITTKPGIRKIEIFQEMNNLSDLFQVEDPFEGVENYNFSRESES